MLRKPTPAQTDARLRLATMPLRNSTTTEPYRGAELRSTNHRAGAQDAFRLPSRTFYGSRTREEA